MFSNSTKQYAQTLIVCFQHFEGVFLNAAQFLHNDCIIGVVFIQVPFENEISSATEKPFGGYFELKNGISRQVHETSANIVCLHLCAKSAGDLVQVFASE